MADRVSPGTSCFSVRCDTDCTTRAEIGIKQEACHAVIAKGTWLVSQGSWVRYPVWQHTFVSPSAFSRRAVVSYWRMYVHEVLVNRLGGLSLPRKSVVRLTDRPDMTLDVYRGRKTTKQSKAMQRLWSACTFLLYVVGIYRSSVCISFVMWRRLIRVYSVC